MSHRLLLLVVVVSLVSCGNHSSTPSPTASAPRAGARPHTTPTRAVPSTVARARLTRWRLPYPVARAAMIGARSGSVILAGGLLDGDVTTGRVERLDLGSGAAATLPPLAVAVHDAAGVQVGGVPTVVGGGNTSEQSLVQSLIHGRWRQVGSLPTTRSDLSLVGWRQRAFVIGGYDGGSAPRRILRISGDARPHRIGNLVRGVRYAALTRIRSAAYVFGGEVNGLELDAVQRVDLATGHTRIVGRLPVPLGHAMAVTVGDRALVMGGRTAPQRQTDAMWWFDPATGSFRRAGRLPEPLSDSAPTSSGRRVWLLGGETPQITDRVVEISLRSGHGSGTR